MELMEVSTDSMGGPVIEVGVHIRFGLYALGRLCGRNFVKMNTCGIFVGDQNSQLVHNVRRPSARHLKRCFEMGLAEDSCRTFFVFC